LAKTSKPVILTVDDEEQVRNAVERDLRKQYRREYRVIKTASGAEALETLEELKTRGDLVAMFIADQRMPGMGGTEFLGKAKEIFPEARKVLLTAYADTDAALQAINQVGLDHYLLKPWDPPEENLYPVLDDLLTEWKSTARTQWVGIVVMGTLWSANSHKIKDFLSRSQIPYKWQDIEQDHEAKWMVDMQSAQTKGESELPLVLIPGSKPIFSPSLTELADRLVGHKTRAAEVSYDMVVVGAGPAGLAAALYGASEGLTTLLVDKETTGGQAGTSSRIENYLGFPSGISGAELARRATMQARRLGAEILTAQEVTEIELREGYPIVKLADGNEIGCKALVIATGVAVRRLALDNVDDMAGAGIFYGAAMSEAEPFRDRHVFVVGGANSAGQGAIFLARFASKVTMLVRSSLAKSMSHYLIEQIESTSNIEVLLGTQVQEVHGEGQLTAVTYRHNETGESTTEETPAMFLFIGAKPHTELLDGIVSLSDAGFVLTGRQLAPPGKLPEGWPLERTPFDMETNVPGIFAAGDVRDGVVRRVASAVGQGSAVVSLVHQYLKTV
jgi:thioredoxin reductase (NADPH)